MQVLRTPILIASRIKLIERVVENAPLTRSVVSRFVAGTSTMDAVEATQQLADSGLHVSLDHLGEDTTKPEQALATKDAYLALLEALTHAGLNTIAEVSVKLSAVGQLLDEELAHEHALEICDAASAAGTTVTLDMEDHTTTDSTLGILSKLRQRHPSTGAVIQAYLHRSLDDCRALATEGSRVRLCKGAYNEPDTVAYQSAADVSEAYARCLGVLMSGPGYPMVASHDPQLINLALGLAAHSGRARDTWEIQMLYGIRPDEQKRLVANGTKVRVYVPYGDEWYGYLMRRLAERPANLAFFLRAMGSTK